MWWVGGVIYGVLALIPFVVFAVVGLRNTRHASTIGGMAHRGSETMSESLYAMSRKELVELALERGFSTATRLSRKGLIRVLEQYPYGPRGPRKEDSNG